jgi:hypothetical protein
MLTPFANQQYRSTYKQSESIQSHEKPRPFAISMASINVLHKALDGISFKKRGRIFRVSRRNSMAPQQWLKVAVNRAIYFFCKKAQIPIYLDQAHGVFSLPSLSAGIMTFLALLQPHPGKSHIVRILIRSRFCWRNMQRFKLRAFMRVRERQSLLEPVFLFTLRLSSSTQVPSHRQSRVRLLPLTTYFVPCPGALLAFAWRWKTRRKSLQAWQPFKADCSKCLNFV